MFRTSSLSIKELICLLEQLQNSRHYCQPIISLSNSTIGQHTRHIIELYQCLLAGYGPATVNYDKRKRDKILETEVAPAISALEKINEQLQKENKEIEVVCEMEDMRVSLSSSYYREVYYNLEHCIHHQALIKVALVEMKINIVSDQFGVAPSTTRYRKNVHSYLYQQ